jgi:hypothetical protein
MKKIIAFVLFVCFATGGVSSNASASTPTKRFPNCSSLNKTYPNGVARSRAAVKSTGAKVSRKVYDANKRLDRDKDGIVCEKANVAAAPGSFGSGTKIVGGGIPAGRYITTTASSCYWARLSGFGGTLDDIIANDNPSGSHVIVDILPSDKGFDSSRCGTWKPFVPTPPTTFGEGVFAIGSEMSAGTWTATFTTSCYWARLSGFGGTLDEIIANDNPTSSAVVTILPTDVGFESSRCGTWTKVG